MNRKLFRLLLLILLLVTAGISWYTNKLNQYQPITYDWESAPNMEEVKRFREYIRIDTTWPRADTSGAVRFWKEMFAEIGVPSETFQVGDNRYIFIARLGPDNGLPPLILHHHMDTSPVRSPEKWKHPPFSADIEGYWLWGRGTIDMKHYGSIFYEAIRTAIREQWKFLRPVLFVATPTEEMEMVYGVPWLMEHHSELFTEGAIFLTEGGAFEMVTDRVTYYGIMTFQKEWIFFEPGRLDDDRLLALKSELELLFPKDELTLSPASEEIFQRLAPHRISYRDILENIGEFLRNDPEKVMTIPDGYLSLMRREFYLNPYPDDPTRYRLVVSLLPGDDPPEWRKRVSQVLRSVALPVETSFISPKIEVSSTESDPFRAIVASVRDVFPGIDTGPYASPWKMNEGQYLRDGKHVSLGIAFVPLNIFDATHAGAPNERIHLTYYLQGLTLGKRLLHRLACDQ